MGKLVTSPLDSFCQCGVNQSKLIASDDCLLSANQLASNRLSFAQYPYLAAAHSFKDSLLESIYDKTFNFYSILQLRLGTIGRSCVLVQSVWSYTSAPTRGFIVYIDRLPSAAVKHL